MERTLDHDVLAPLLGRQKQALQAAKARKGQKPGNKATRLQLGVEFHLMKQHATKVQLAQGHNMRQYFISHAYPPSTTSLSELQPIVISDLRLETHHRGKVLFVRTFGHPVRVSGVQNAVEDEHGDVDRLSLYNVDPLTNANHLLPKDGLFAIKEPFYKGTADGGVSLRVDHPSDLVRLQPLDPRVPDSLCPRFVELDKSADDWKKEGNAAYKEKDYLTAEDVYSQGLLTCGDDDEALKRDLLRNRSMVNIRLKRCERALRDATESIIPTSAGTGEKTVELNAKAHFRAGRAAFELGQFEKAKFHYESMQALTPEDQDAARQLKRTVERQAEMLTGSYDFAKMSKSASKNKNRLDHASFIANVIVRDAGKHGRGLFATRDDKAGELILCEKAFCAAFDSDEGGATYMIINLNTERGSMGTQATLLFNCVQKMIHGPAQAERFLDLYDGGHEPRILAQEVDDVVVVDTFRTQAIIEHNCFGCPTVRSTSAASKASSRPDDERSSGIWITASYINHACNGNAMRSFIGDMMIVRATKHIDAGQEILMPYRLPGSDHNTLREQLQRS